MSEPITREETYLAAIAGDGVDLPNPITREEMYLAAAAGMPVELPNPITRKEQFLQRVVETGGTGGGGVTIRNQNKTITKNGSYKADSGYTGLGTVTVNVPQEDPVLQDKTATQNGKYTADSGFDGLGTVTVAVPEPVLQDKTVTENGEYTADAGYDGLGKVTVNVAASGGSGGTEDIAKSILDKSITEYSNSEVTYIGESAFCKCKNLTRVDLPNLVSVEAYVFSNCTALVDVNVPSLTNVYNNRCFEKTGIVNISLPLLKKIGGGMFYNCASLKHVYAPVAVEVGMTAFEGCTALEEFDAPDTLYQLLATCFQGSGVKTLVLRHTQKAVTLANVSAFNKTAFASGGTGGTVYVPEALISAYQTATNWSTLYAAGTCNFVAIEGSEYE